MCGKCGKNSNLNGNNTCRSRHKPTNATPLQLECNARSFTQHVCLCFTFAALWLSLNLPHPSFMVFALVVVVVVSTFFSAITADVNGCYFCYFYFSWWLYQLIYLFSFYMPHAVVLFVFFFSVRLCQAVA